MFAEPHVDPRYRTLRPTADEIEAWAAREKKRREAWVAGPTDEETAEWARRSSHRVPLDLDEPPAPPTKDETDAWAKREHERRKAWLEGPTEDEKAEWVLRAKRRAGMGLAEPDFDAERWAEREKSRRREWAAGPSDEEKREWARRQEGGLFDFPLPGAAFEADFFDMAHRVLREAELMGKGSFYTFLRGPSALRSLQSFFAKAGEAFEEEMARGPRRGRVPY